jgi:hypothetical protein
MTATEPQSQLRTEFERESPYVDLTIAQGLIRMTDYMGHQIGEAWCQPMDPVDERWALHRVTAELIVQYPHLNDSYLGPPIPGHPGWFYSLPEDPTLAGWVCGHYLTIHQPTGSKIGYRKVFREVNGQIIKIWEQEG